MLLNYLQRNGLEIPNAETESELDEKYADYLGLFYQCKAWCNKPGKETVALDGLVVDFPYEEVEARTILNDYLVHPDYKEAVRMFMDAWMYREQGKNVPRALRDKLTQQRRVTGLPLVLQRGRAT